MKAHNDSIQLLNRWKSGDEQAAAELFDRYVSRLVALAGSRLSEALRRRVEAEDVVQSVYRSFFARTSDDRLVVEENGQLWGLLAAITINKVRTHAKYHRAQKRDVSAEASMSASRSCFGLAPVEVADEPTADVAAALVEELGGVLDTLTPLQRDVFELYLQNQPNDKIALEVKRSARTVRRTLEEVRRLLEQRLGDGANDDV
jgi:RNA polymerase sigma-70 factor (ECF subfamily)